MQLVLIFGIAFATVAVLFALQNNVPVTVTLAFWRFDGSLAVVLLLALGLGALIAGLVSSPTVIRRQWAVVRLRRQIATMENEKAALQRRVRELEATASGDIEITEAQPPDRPYVGIRNLISRDKPEDTA